MAAQRQAEAAPTDNGTADPGTAETRRKLRRDVVAGLAARGRITPEQHRAAEEIRQVWEAVGRGLFPTASRLAPKVEGAGPRARPPRDFIDRMRAHEYRAWKSTYVPWAREEAVTLLAGAGGPTRLQLVIDIVVDNHGPRQLEDRYAIRRHGAALGHLRAGLARYVAVAGWGGERK